MQRSNSTFVLGLTGGIGCGKTAATSQFSLHGIQIIDADAIARQVVEPGSPALKKIIAHFEGSDISPKRLLLHKFEISVSEKDSAESVRLLSLMKNKYRLVFNNLSQLPRYADLLKSSEYKKWQFENRQ